MTLVGFVGLLLALAAAYVADLRYDRRRIGAFALLLVLHTLACVAFYAYILQTGGDAEFYYYDRLQWRGASGLGTVFVVNLVQFLRDAIGGTFFDYFLLFNAVGFWGLVYLTKVLHETFDELGLDQSLAIYLPLFLPGLHFWTGAIGKDAPLFFGICLSIWAAMRFNRRYVAFAVAVAVMLLFRPHIAFLALISLAGAAFFDKRVGLLLKMGMLGGAVIGGSIFFSSMQTTYRVDLTSADSVADFVAERSNITEESGGDAVILNASVPLRIVYLWTRPFFFDADSLLAYVASAENAALLFMMVLILANHRLFWNAAKAALYVRYSTLIFLSVTVLVGAVNFNVGLGLRQKMMAVPGLLAVFFAVVALQLARTRLAEARQRQAADETWRRGKIHAPTPSRIAPPAPGD